MQIKDITTEMVKKWYYIVGIVGVVGIIAIIIWGYQSIPMKSETESDAYMRFHKGWSQIVGGECIPLENIQEFYPVKEEEALTFVCTLPKNLEEKLLLFYSNNKEVTCSVDGKILHEFIIQDGYEILKTPGSVWNQVNLDSSMEGKDFCLTLYSPLKPYNNMLRDIYLIDAIDVNSVLLNELWFHYAIAIGSFCLILVAFVNAIVWKQPQRKRYFFALGQFYCFVLLYLLGTLNFYDIFTGRPILSYLIEQIFIRFVPLGMWCLTVNSTNKYWHPLIVKTIGTFTVINATMPWVLQFIFGVSLLETTWIHVICFLTLSIVFIFIIGEKYTNFSTLNQEEYPCLLLIVLYLVGIIDLFILLIRPEIKTYSGIISVVGGLIYIIFTFLIIMNINANTAIEKVEIEHSYQKLQTTTLMQQINAHFIFNTLNTISAFCKVAPNTADMAIKTFASYLRSYIYLANNQESIQVIKELELVESYLKIEQMRFENHFYYNFNIAYDEFTIPPLSLQTLIENAVIHGIRKKKQIGEIVVTTKRVEKYAQVIVSDNGEGFDTSKPCAETSIGLNNVKKRINMIPGAKLVITSQVGAGTKVEMLLPIE